MFLRNGMQPWHLMVVALVVILLFGSKKLPDSARSLGKSLRILKSEARAMRRESSEGSPESGAPDSDPGEAPREVARPAPGGRTTDD